jgi:N-methylhydantoinase A
MYRLGIDIGGTFTDFVLLNEATGSLAFHKQLTTPDITRGLVHGLEVFLGQEAVRLNDVVEIRHATTLGGNVVIERKGPTTALVTTRGFRDVLAIQRALRYHMFDLHIRKPTPLIPRRLIYEVTERIAHDGTVVTPLDDDDVRRIAGALSSTGIGTVAVALLHAYANPVHEHRVRAILEHQMPGLLVSVSSDISLQAREYERTSTTVMNAYIRPTVAAYLTHLLMWLREHGFRGSLHVMQCNGGLATVETMTQYPVRMIESGPAAGAIAAIYYGRLTGVSNLLALDMGGTTAKACLIEQLQPLMVQQFEIARLAMRRGSGLPLDVPAVDLVEIGAGGGSLARARLGTIQVGPDSAGSSPGPICYARGGVEPTVTDANLALGYLNPAYFCGGTIPLNREAATNGILERVARPLGLDGARAALGIHEVVTANMAQALRMVSVARGKDPRHFTLVATGGAGPAHACRLARELGIERVILPAGAGVASAIGLLTADTRFDLSRTRIHRLDGDGTGDTVRKIFEELQERVAELARARSNDPAPELVYEAYMRYTGQGFEIPVRVDLGTLNAKGVPALLDAFQRAYYATYADTADEPVEGVHWKLTAVWPSSTVALARLREEPATTALKEWRPVYFPETSGYTRCPVYGRGALAVGETIGGPAVIEDPESTAVLLPGDQAQTDPYGNLIVTTGRAR